MRASWVKKGERYVLVATREHVAPAPHLARQVAGQVEGARPAAGGKGVYAYSFPAPYQQPGYSPCVHPQCPCPASWNGRPGEHCCLTCRDGTPCVTACHQQPFVGGFSSSTLRTVADRLMRNVGGTSRGDAAPARQVAYTAAQARWVAELRLSPNARPESDSDPSMPPLEDASASSGGN